MSVACAPFPLSPLFFPSPPSLGDVVARACYRKESPANANVVLRRTTNGHGVVAGACVGILAATVLLFTVVRYAILLRKWATESKLGMTGKFSSRRPRGGAGEIMEIDHVPFQSVQTKTAGS